MARYRTAEEAIEAIYQELGEYADDYDVEMIFSYGYRWCIDRDDKGNELLHTGGFEMNLSEDEYRQLMIKAAR